jgi:hypothetical protein
VVSVSSGPDMVSSPHSSGIFETTCKRTVNLDHFCAVQDKVLMFLIKVIPKPNVCRM